MAYNTTGRLLSCWSSFFPPMMLENMLFSFSLAFSLDVATAIVMESLCSPRTKESLSEAAATGVKLSNMASDGRNEEADGEDTLMSGIGPSVSPKISLVKDVEKLSRSRSEEEEEEGLL
jgi:hypothetical protein